MEYWRKFEFLNWQTNYDLTKLMIPNRMAILRI